LIDRHFGTSHNNLVLGINVATILHDGWSDDFQFQHTVNGPLVNDEQRPEQLNVGDAIERDLPRPTVARLIRVNERASR
jgi:hypothetical protein